jgi:hypothetical protein
MNHVFIIFYRSLKFVFLPAPYNWRTYPEMNVGFWKKHQTTPLMDAKTMLRESHAEVMALIETFSNDELFSSTAPAFPLPVKQHLPALCL